jgi:succinyl-CoA synthetase beta subunit
MKIHEYQAKALLEAAGASVPKGIVVSSPKEAVAAFDQLGGGPVVLKAQVHAGGRGKGRFKDSGSDIGGVKYITKRADIEKVAEIMFKYPLVTKQTGEEGQRVSKVLVQFAVDINKRSDGRDDEYYVGMVLDRAIGLPVLMASAEGGVEIEEVAAKTPEKIIKVPVAPETGLAPFQARRLAFELGFVGEQVHQAEKILQALGRVFIEKDCSLAEINPLVVTKPSKQFRSKGDTAEPEAKVEPGQVLALDAKITFDENALFRHPDVEALRDLGEENPAEIRAAKAGLNFIQLTGNIGCLVNGAGLAMGTMDIIKYHGGDPANFLDVGGGVTPEGAIEAFRIILSDPKVKGILVNIFGGIAKCDLIAEALVKAGREVGFKVPVVVRLEGTNVEKAREILNGVKKELPMIQAAPGLTEAAKMVVAAAR